MNPFSTLGRFLAPCAMASLLALTGCATNPNVRTQVDKSTDFTALKTFGFVQPLGTEKSGYRPVVSQQLMASAQRELEARGLRRSDSAPQLLVNFNAKLQQVMHTDPIDVGQGMQGGYYSYRIGLYGTWEAYDNPATGTPYVEGTLNVDVVNATTRKLVWESVVTDTLTDAKLDNLRPTVDAAVSAAFAKYPVQKPEAAPTLSGGSGY